MSTDKEGVSATESHVMRVHMKKIADVRESVVMKQQHQTHTSYERTVHALVVSVTLVKELNRSS